jgi:NAD(P)-dependent dehydrogenase (short-subunit alcohol dehydrogenase family)
VYEIPSDDSANYPPNIDQGKVILTLFLCQDMGVREDCSNVVKATIEQLGGLDIVVSNAVSWQAEFST